MVEVEQTPMRHSETPIISVPTAATRKCPKTSQLSSVTFPVVILFSFFSLHSLTYLLTHSLSLGSILGADTGTH